MRGSRFAAAVLVAGVLATATALAGPLEGRWKLVEQTYAEGRSGRLELDEPIRLEFVRQGGKLVGWTWPTESGQEIVRWPSLQTVEGRMRVETIEISPAEDRVRARYGAGTSSDGRVRLHFVEEYGVGDDPDTLTGTLTVSVVRDGEPAGSMHVRRRFVREP